MALFKIKRGLAATLPTTYVEGYCYFTTDDGKFYIDTTNTAAGRITLNAYKADILRTARNLQVDLESTSYVSFDGSVDRKNIGISGVLGVANGGTGKSTHTANAVLTGNGTSAVKNVATASGALYATATNGAPKFGTLPVAQGGTGLTANPSMLINLASNSAASVLAASPRPGVTGTLAVGNGGTGKTSWTANALIYAATTTSLGQIDLGTSGYVLQSNGSANAPSWINATSNNTASTIVKRDSSGNFSANRITANLTASTTGGSWASFKTDAAIQQKMRTTSTGWATSFFRTETPTGRMFVYGGHDNEQQYGFYLFEKDSNTIAWKTYWNLTNGEFYHDKGIHATTFYGALSGNATTATSAGAFTSAASVTLTGDVTGTASSTKGWSVATTLANSGVTAGSYGPSANATPAHGGTFSVPYITFDAKGRATAASTKTITLPTYGVFTGASSSAAGIAGLVPAPAKGAQGYFLRGDGTWYNFLDLNNTALDTISEIKAAWESADGTLKSTLENAIGKKVTTGSAEYIKGLSISGRIITYTKGDGTTGTLTTQDTDTNTHYTTKIYAGASGATSNSTSAVSNPYLTVVDDSTYRTQVRFSGSGATSVSANGGTITISSSNTTYSAGTGLSLSGTTFNHSNSITAGSVGSAQSPSHGGTFAIPKITYDAQGHITAATTVNITLPADNNTHYTANLLLGASGATTTSTTAVSNPYIILRENGTNRNQIQIKAGSNVTVSGDDGIITISSSYTNTTYSQATSSTLGLVKIGYTASGKNYPVQLNTDGQMYVNVPWTNTTYTLSGLGGISDITFAGTSLTKSGTTASITQAVARTALGLGSNAYSSTAYLPLTGGTLTGKLQVNNLIFGYNYTNGNNRAAFLWDKPGSNYTGMGACGDADTIYFGAADGDGNWVTTYRQKWKFNGSLVVGGGDDNCNIVPWTNNYSTIGTESLKWWKIYATSIYGDKVYGAVWNDYAEYRWVLKHPDTDEPIEPGRCVAENGNDSMSLTNARLQAGVRIISDTYGMCMGETEKAKTPVAVCGRVLAYPFERKVAFNVGDPVCSGPNGTVSKMSREEAMMYPERIVGTVVSKPTYKEWGPNKIPVNGRIWIQVR